MSGDCRWSGSAFLSLPLWPLENSFFDVFSFTGDDSLSCSFLSFCVDSCGGEVALSLTSGLEGSTGIPPGSDFRGAPLVLPGGLEGIGGAGLLCLVKFAAESSPLVGCLSSLSFGLKCVALLSVRPFKSSGG